MTNSKAFYQVNEYLSLWKKSMDEKSLNPDLRNKVIKKGPFKRILDIGTGSGTQIRRNIEDGLVENNGLVIGIDVNEDGLKNSINDFKYWCEEVGYNLDLLNNEDGTLLEFNLSKNDFKCLVKLYSMSVYDIKDNSKLLGSDFDLVTALSLFEHTNIEQSLESVKSIMKKDSLLYATINYDGITKTRPLPNGFSKTEDDSLMKLFNEIVINKQHVGGVDVGESLCGTVMPKIAESMDFKILGVGNSDWKIGGDSNDYNRYAYKLFIGAIRDGLLNLNDAEKQKIKDEYGVKDERINLWYDSALKNFENKKGVFFCNNKDILLQK